MAHFDGAVSKSSVDESLEKNTNLPTVQSPPQSGSTIENKNESRRAYVEATDSGVISSQPRQRNGRPLRAFISGMAFILSVFMSYYLLGFGIFTAISSSKVSEAILLALGVFIIILGLWNIKNFFCYNSGWNIEIRRSWRPLLKRILGAVTSPIGAFLAGFVVCLFELPCTGGAYLFILGSLGGSRTRKEAALLLLFYNFIFVMPLIIINCLVYLGSTTLQNVADRKDRYIRHLHLFAGTILIGLGTLAIVDSFVQLY